MVFIMVEARAWFNQVLFRNPWQLWRVVIVKVSIRGVSVKYVEELLEVGRGFFEVGRYVFKIKV